MIFPEQLCVRARPFLCPQDQPPYNLKAFNLCIDFSKEYPFKPPTVKFTTKIYHPNVSENGEVCLPLLSKENWKPNVKACQGGAGPGPEEGLSWVEVVGIKLEKPKRGEIKM